MRCSHRLGQRILESGKPVSTVLGLAQLEEEGAGKSAGGTQSSSNSGAAPDRAALEARLEALRNTEATTKLSAADLKDIGKEKGRIKALLRA